MFMSNNHYTKYKDTIKKVARRNYYKRVHWLNEYLIGKACKHCGESEAICLKFHPHDAKIRKLSKRKGLNEASREEIKQLLSECVIVCSNCWLKIDNDLIEFV